jgi:signal transduction histidine kinase
VGSAFLFVSRPMRLLVAKLERVGKGDLSRPLVLRQRDEIGELAGAINAMCEQLALALTQLEAEAQRRIAAVEQMRHADRLSIVGQLASGVAHELGTPLNVVLAHARETSRDPYGPAAGSDAAAIVEQAERMAAIIRQLLDLSRRHTPDKQLEDVGALVGKTFSVLAPVASRHGIELRIEPTAKPVTADVDAGQIQQVLANLVMNAIHSQPRGGRVSARVELSSDAAEVRIRIEDSGSGIPTEARDRIFEPFFTTKAPGEGTGLGLTVSYGIVNEHGGRIEVESVEGLGSTFTVCLPAAPGAATYERAV